MVKPYYEEKGITIYHGDCREILPSLPKVDLVLTDPPYGIEQGFVDRPSKWRRRAGAQPQSWDKKIDGQFFLDLDALHAELIVWGGNNYFLSPCRGWLSWFKPDAPPSMAQFELAWRNVDANARQISCSIAETNAERVGHPTQKPLKVMRWCIAQSTVPQDALILDPFMGSGTTLRAAKDLGRRAIGIEIEERYCEIAANRLKQEVLNFEAVA